MAHMIGLLERLRSVDGYLLLRCRRNRVLRACAAVGKPLCLVIDQLAHIYKGFDTFSVGKGGWFLQSRRYLYPAWEINSYSVAGYTCVHYSTVFRCTVLWWPTLTREPRFLTSSPPNQCISSQSGNYGASSMEFFLALPDTFLQRRSAFAPRACPHIRGADLWPRLP
jgi:hypothetical protein